MPDSDNDGIPNNVEQALTQSQGGLTISPSNSTVEMVSSVTASMDGNNQITITGKDSNGDLLVRAILPPGSNSAGEIIINYRLDIPPYDKGIGDISGITVPQPGKTMMLKLDKPANSVCIVDRIEHTSLIPGSNFCGGPSIGHTMMSCNAGPSAPIILHVDNFNDGLTTDVRDFGCYQEIINGQTYMTVSGLIHSTLIGVQNSAPIANAGVDTSVNEGALVQLDGSGSFDSDNNQLTFSWLQTSGPAVILSGADTAQPTFIAPTVTSSTIFTFELRVNDGLAFASDTVAITVIGLDNDGDGFASDADCDDSDPNTFPGATEIRAGKDNNCNNQVDEGLTEIISIDIKPGSYPSSVKCKKTKNSVPVAIFGSATFDVLTVNLATLSLNGVGVRETHGKIHIMDANEDAYPDAVLHLDSKGVCKATEDAPLKQTVFVTLAGLNLDGNNFEGTGDIRIVSRHVAKSHKQ